jgi:hypothetical protein
LYAELNKVRSFECAFGEKYPVVGDDSDGISHESGEAADQRRPIERFELVKIAIIYQPGYDLAYIVAFAALLGNKAVELVGLIAWRPCWSYLPRYIFTGVKMRDNAAADRQGMLII